MLYTSYKHSVVVYVLFAMLLSIIVFCRSICRTFEWLRERTEHLNIFLFSAYHSVVFYF